MGKLSEKFDNFFGLTEHDVKIPTDKELDYDTDRLNYYLRVSYPLFTSITKRKLGLYLRYKWRRVLLNILKLLFFCSIIYFSFDIYNRIYKSSHTEELENKKISIIHDYLINNPIPKENLVFMNTIARLESKDKSYLAVNGQYWGKYQMGNLARKEVGIGDMTKDKFLNNQYIQDWAVNEYIMSQYKLLKNTIIKYKIPQVGGIVRGNQLITISGLIAAAHLSGWAPVKYFIESDGRDLIVDGKNLSYDGNNVHLTKYLQLNNIPLKLDNQ
jgi:hypothetical protein